MKRNEAVNDELWSHRCYLSPRNFRVNVIAAHATATRPLKSRWPIMAMLLRPCQWLPMSLDREFAKHLPKYADVPPHMPMIAHFTHSHVTSDRCCGLHFSHIAATISWLNLTIATQQGMSRYAGSMKSLWPKQTPKKTSAFSSLAYVAEPSVLKGWNQMKSRVCLEEGPTCTDKPPTRVRRENQIKKFQIQSIIQSRKPKPFADPPHKDLWKIKKRVWILNFALGMDYGRGRLGLK